MYNELIISLASNYEPAQNLPRALSCLRQVLAVTHVTEAIWTEPVGSSRFRVHSSEFTVQSSEFTVQSSEFRVHSSESTAQSSESTVPSPQQYLNQLVYATTTLDADQLERFFKQVERGMGRTDAMRQQGLVPIDIDLLLHGTTRYHAADWQRDYVRRLLL